PRFPVVERRRHRRRSRNAHRRLGAGRFVSLRSLNDRRSHGGGRDRRLAGGRPGLAAGNPRQAPAQRTRAGGHAYCFFCLRVSISCGTTVNRSPTTPKSAISKIGASGSLLIATIVLAVCIPARCWIAPEIPSATYSCGDTETPVCPTWCAYGM